VQTLCKKERLVHKKPHKQSANLAGKILTRKEESGRGETILRLSKFENRGECATRGDFEYRTAGGVVGVTAGPAEDCRPVEVSVGALYQRVDIGAVRVVETVQCRQRAAGSDFDDRAITIGPATARRPVEISIGAQYQPDVWASRIRVVRNCAASSARRRE
jgi:hypothetical protein